MSGLTIKIDEPTAPTIQIDPPESRRKLSILNVNRRNIPALTIKIETADTPSMKIDPPESKGNSNELSDRKVNVRTLLGNNVGDISVTPDDTLLNVMQKIEKDTISQIPVANQWLQVVDDRVTLNWKLNQGKPEMLVSRLTPRNQKMLGLEYTESDKFQPVQKDLLSKIKLLDMTDENAKQVCIKLFIKTDKPKPDPSKHFRKV